MSLRAAIATALGLASACNSEVEPTRALVEVRTNFGDELSSLEVAVSNRQDPERRRSETFPLSPSRDPDLLLSFAVAPSGGHNDGEFLVTVIGNDAQGSPLVWARAAGRFTPRKYVNVQLWLSQRCEHVECPDPTTTCSDRILNEYGMGTCVPLDSEYGTAGQEAPSSDAGRWDARTDGVDTHPAGATDGGTTDARVSVDPAGSDRRSDAETVDSRPQAIADAGKMGGKSAADAQADAIPPVDASETGEEDSGNAKSDGGMSAQPVSISGTASGCQSYTKLTENKCGGYYCGVTETQLAAAWKKGSKCDGVDTDRSIMYSCNASLVFKVAQCARDHALDGSDEQVRMGEQDCVYQDADFKRDVPGDCLDCFLDVAACAYKNCLVECLTGDSPDCDDCRKMHNCEEPVFACGGLPDPF